jgi:hypothetical protein
VGRGCRSNKPHPQPTKGWGEPIGLRSPRFPHLNLPPAAIFSASPDQDGVIDRGWGEVSPYQISPSPHQNWGRSRRISAASHIGKVVRSSRTLHDSIGNHKGSLNPKPSSDLDEGLGSYGGSSPDPQYRTFPEMGSVLNQGTTLPPTGVSRGDTERYLGTEFHAPPIEIGGEIRVLPLLP